MNKERLLILANHLESIARTTKPKRIFDMGSWMVNRDCGTAACAIGEATTIPEFQKAGLQLKNFGNGLVPYISGYLNYKKIGRESFIYDPKCDSNDEGLREYDAVAWFFDIKLDKARKLFSPHSYEDEHNPLLVASAIRKAVKKYEDKQLIKEWIQIPKEEKKKVISVLEDRFLQPFADPQHAETLGLAIRLLLNQK